MKNKTKVEIVESFQHMEDCKIGDMGYIDGYVRGGDGRPYAVVIIGCKLKMIPIYCLEVVEF